MILRKAIVEKVVDIACIKGGERQLRRIMRRKNGQPAFQGARNRRDHSDALIARACSLLIRTIAAARHKILMKGTVHI
jgi:hypothetical protein